MKLKRSPAKDCRDNMTLKASFRSEDCTAPAVFCAFTLYFILVKRYSYKHRISFTRGTVFISGGCYFMSVEQHAPISLNKVCKLLHQSQCDAAKGRPSGLWFTVHSTGHIAIPFHVLATVRHVLCCTEIVLFYNGLILQQPKLEYS